MLTNHDTNHSTDNHSTDNNHSTANMAHDIPRILRRMRKGYYSLVTCFLAKAILPNTCSAPAATRRTNRKTRDNRLSVAGRTCIGEQLQWAWERTGANLGWCHEHSSTMPCIDCAHLEARC